jgi:hypothetical protein
MDGAYVIYDSVQEAVRFVGRSRDVRRRLRWWERHQGSPYADAHRFRGVQLATRRRHPPVEWFSPDHKGD